MHPCLTGSVGQSGRSFCSYGRDVFIQPKKYLNIAETSFSRGEPQYSLPNTPSLSVVIEKTHAPDIERMRAATNLPGVNNDFATGTAVAAAASGSAVLTLRAALAAFASDTVPFNLLFRRNFTLNWDPREKIFLEAKESIVCNNSQTNPG
jgi:hypothetical protein